MDVRDGCQGTGMDKWLGSGDIFWDGEYLQPIWGGRYFLKVQRVEEKQQRNLRHTASLVWPRGKFHGLPLTVAVTC